MRESGRSGRSSFVDAVTLVLVLGLLVALMAPVTERRTAASRKAECAGNLHQIALGLIQYAMDFDQQFPSVTGFINDSDDTINLFAGDAEESLGLLYDRYIPDANCFRCPSAPPADVAGLACPATGGANASFRLSDLTSYGYDPRHLFTHQFTHQPGVAIMADGGGGVGVNSPNHGGGGQNVLFINGHAKWSTVTKCGYEEALAGADEIYRRDDDGSGGVTLDDNRHDSWLANSRTHEPLPDEFEPRERPSRRKRKPPVAVQEPREEGLSAVSILALAVVVAGGLIALAIVTRPGRKQKD